MAKYQVTHSCGHTQTVQLFGHHTERDKKIEWFERTLCPDCYRAQKETECQQENDRALDLVGKIGFTPLTGSDKQVVWATSIRQKAYETIIARNIIVDAGIACKILNLEASAKWWIDNRSGEPTTICKAIFANYRDECKAINEEYISQNAD